MKHLESKIAAPTVDPELILALVKNLPSSTIDAPRDLPSLLQERLRQVAAINGGRVNLQGRLFAQWMHHAYPRECPFPRVSGSTNPLSQEDWLGTMDGELPLATR